MMKQQISNFFFTNVLKLSAHKSVDCALKRKEKFYFQSSVMNASITDRVPLYSQFKQVSSYCRKILLFLGKIEQRLWYQWFKQQTGIIKKLK